MEDFFAVDKTVHFCFGHKFAKNSFYPMDKWACLFLVEKRLRCVKMWVFEKLNFVGMWIRIFAEQKQKKNAIYKYMKNIHVKQVKRLIKGYHHPVYKIETDKKWVQGGPKHRGVVSKT